MKMRSSTASLAISALLFAGSATIVLAQGQTLAVTATPARSSIVVPGSEGQVAHTFLQVLASPADLAAAGLAPGPLVGPPFAGLYSYQTPASIACIYSLPTTGPKAPGCNPYGGNSNPFRGGRALAIVDAYDDPNACADLNFFSTQFGLPLATCHNPSIAGDSFQVVFAPAGTGTASHLPSVACAGGFPPQGPRPPSALPTGWDVEESLDVQWAHAMAPGATTLYLVEAQSNSFVNLNCAAAVAGYLVNAAGGGEVSMSFGSGEFPAELTFDTVYTWPNVVYFASSGDNPGVSHPSASPNVVSVGGTTVNFNSSTFAFEGENTWYQGGGGESRYEPPVPWQSVGTFLSPGNPIYLGPVRHRTTPDIASDANPYTGVWVQDSLECGGASPCWGVVGGTSVASPTWAGIVNAAGSFLASTLDELTRLYLDPSAMTGGFSDPFFNDVAVGSYGVAAQPLLGATGGSCQNLIYTGDNSTQPGWDVCTGLGSPKGYGGK
jgi:kumamolisin